MERTEELVRLSAAEARRRIADGRLTATRLAEAYLERIAQREDSVGAWQFLDRNLVLMQARERDRAANQGLMHGVPVGIKDIIDTEDMPTQYGSPIYRGHQPGRDAACVALMRAAGAVILGKTVTTEFAVYSPGKTRNPFAYHHTPGGSSSGSAAAVADWQVPVATGTQTAGSIIRPAAYCGAVGYKPTFGRFNYDGIKPTAASLDTLGLFTNYFEDLHLVSGVLLGLKKPARSDPAGKTPRPGFCRTPWWEQGGAEMHRVVEDTVAKLAKAGAPVREIALPHFFDDMLEAQDLIMCHEDAIYLRYEYENHRSKLSPRLCELIEKGLNATVAQIQAARVLARRCRGYVSGLFSEVDVLVAPATLGTAPAGIDATGDPIYERLWTCLGNPCVSYRSGSGANGLPLGVQVIGPLGGDDALIDFAAWMASHTRQLNP